MEEIIALSNEVFKDFAYDMTVEIGKLGNPTRETAENTNTVRQSVGA